MKHEQRIVQHLSGYKERINRCICGRMWPCIKMFEPEITEELMTDQKPSTPIEEAKAAVHAVLTMYGPTSLHASVNKAAHRALDIALANFEQAIRREPEFAPPAEPTEPETPPVVVAPPVEVPPLPPGSEAKTDDGSIVIKDELPPPPAAPETTGKPKKKG